MSLVFPRQPLPECCQLLEVLNMQKEKMAVACFWFGVVLSWDLEYLECSRKEECERRNGPLEVEEVET